MPSRLEIAANAVNIISIALATFNTVHTWWTGIIGCVLFAWLFFDAKLYADVTLQAFFIGTSALGWWMWLHGDEGQALAIRRSRLSSIAKLAVLAVAIAAGYALLLQTYTDAYAPAADSLVLTFSVLAQFLLMQRRVETWWFWLMVNTVAVPLYISRELYVTAVFYAAFWINSCVGLARWQRLA
jgi:nicotinamide mononucleotide transporter